MRSCFSLLVMIVLLAVVVGGGGFVAYLSYNTEFKRTDQTAERAK